MLSSILLRSLPVCLAATLLVAGGAVAESPVLAQNGTEFALKDGDRVVFYGDSITEQRLYTTYVEHYVLTHYPQRRITFINTGWGGDKVTSNDCVPCAGVGGLARIDRDVIRYKPTVVTLLFGMNDGRYQDFDAETMKVYEDGLTAIIRELKSKTSARIFVMTPTVYDGTRNTPWSHTTRYNDVLDRYSEAAKQIATREKLPVVDLHAVTTDVLRRAKSADASYTFLPDGVHPEEDGQLVMAAELLRAWGALPSGVEMGRAVKPGPDNTAALSVTAPLPWPHPAPSEQLQKVAIGIVESGSVRVRVMGLRGRYRVNVDGKDAGDFDGASLEKGLSIGALSPGAVEQSMTLATLIRKRADLFFMRWRQVEAPLAKDYKTAAQVVSSFDSLIDEMTERARGLGALHEYLLKITKVD